MRTTGKDLFDSVRYVLYEFVNDDVVEGDLRGEDTIIAETTLEELDIREDRWPDLRFQFAERFFITGGLVEERISYDPKMTVGQLSDQLAALYADLDD